MITFRPYIPSDREACLQLFHSNMPPYFDPTELPLFEQFLEGQNVGVPGKSYLVEEYYYVMEEDGRAIGCGGIALRETGAVCMSWGMVNRELHKKGYGKQLLLYRLEQMHVVFPGKPIELDTTQYSFEFFSKYGFETVKITPDGYAQGLDRYDMLYKVK